MNLSKKLGKVLEMKDKYYNLGNTYYKVSEEYTVVLTDNENEFGWELINNILITSDSGLKEITQEEFQKVNQRVLNRLEQLEV